MQLLAYSSLAALLAGVSASAEHPPASAPRTCPPFLKAPVDNGAGAAASLHCFVQVNFTAGSGRLSRDLAQRFQQNPYQKPELRLRFGPTRCDLCSAARLRGVRRHSAREVAVRLVRRVLGVCAPLPHELPARPRGGHQRQQLPRSCSAGAATSSCRGSGGACGCHRGLWCPTAGGRRASGLSGGVRGLHRQRRRR